MSNDLQTEIEKMRQRADYLAETPSDPASEGWVQTPLEPDDWQARAEAMAKLERERAELVEEKRDRTRNYTAKIKVLDEGIARLADQIETRQKWVDPQMSLPSRLDEAKKARRAVQRGTQDAAAPVEP